MSRTFVTQSLSSTALCIFAALILATSLVSSNRAVNGAKERFSTLEFYWGKQLLPDHPFYVVLMARDRAQLWLAGADKEPTLRFQYAEKRYQAARSLANNSKPDLAISTLSKSQIYVLDAARQLQANGLTAEERVQLRSALDHSLYRLELFQDQHPNLDTELLRSLRSETQSVLASL